MNDMTFASLIDPRIVTRAERLRERKELLACERELTHFRGGAPRLALGACRDRITCSKVRRTRLGLPICATGAARFAARSIFAGTQNQ